MNKKADYARPQIVVYAMNEDVICASNPDNFVGDRDDWDTAEEFI